MNKPHLKPDCGLPMNPLDTKVTLLGMPRRQRPPRFIQGIAIVITNHLRTFTGRLFTKG